MQLEFGFWAIVGSVKVSDQLNALDLQELGSFTCTGVGCPVTWHTPFIEACEPLVCGGIELLPGV